MITPYNAQVRLLSDLFREQGWLEQMSETGGAWDVGGMGGGGGAGGERSERNEGNSRISSRSLGSAMSGSRYQREEGKGGGSGVDGRGGRGEGRGGGRGGDRSREREGDLSSNDKEWVNRDRRSGDRDRDSRSSAQSTIGWVGGRGSFKVSAPTDGAPGYSRYAGKNEKSKGENGGGRGSGSRRESEAEVLSSFSRIKGVKGVSNKQLSSMAAKVRTYVCE